MAGRRSSVKASRRELLATAGALALSAAVGPQAIAAEPGPANARPIPRTGEMLPIVGLGTAIVFDIAGDATKLAEGRQVVETLADGGGKLIDTAPAYGSAEQVVGDLVSATGLRSRLFLATKLGIKDPTASRSELEGSLARLRTDPVDLVQLWNVRDPKQDLAILRDWKAAGHCRYIGITTSRPSDLGALAEICRREKPDFVQLNYSLGTARRSRRPCRRPGNPLRPCW